MERKLSCAVVRDLLPNYIEKLTSEETNREVKAHLDVCAPCTKIYEEMTQEVSQETPQDSLFQEAKDLSRFLWKTKAVAVAKMSVLVILILGIIVNFIVDIAINHRLTWSFLVIACIVYVLCIFLLSVWGGKHRFLKVSVCASVLVLPLLWTIAVFCREIGADSSWLLPIAIPITGIWLAVVWVGILTYWLFQTNVWFSAGLVMILAVPANILTNAIARSVSFREMMGSMDSAINTISYILCAIVLFIIAYLRRGKRI